MKIKLWLVLPLLLSSFSSAIAQTQDIHALSIVTQAFERAKKDNKTRQDTVISIKIHRIENLNAEEEFVSVEKVATFKVYVKDGKLVEELTDIWPPGSKPPGSPVDLDKMLDAFLSRFYFVLDPKREEIDGHRCFKIQFRPKEKLPKETENSDYLLNRVSGVIYIDEETYMVRGIEASLSHKIDFVFFDMNKLDFRVVFQEWDGLGLPQIMTVTTRYSYWKWFKITRRYQTHTFYYEYLSD